MNASNQIEDWYWWCVGTRRIFHELIDQAGVRGKALDVGCDTGAILTEFPPGWTIVAGSDFSPMALSFSRKRGLRQLAVPAPRPVALDRIRVRAGRSDGR